MDPQSPTTFADIPVEIASRVAAGERVALVLLDAFGLEQLERERDHPLHRRLRITPLRSQFPSTTTAHVTTLHVGLPVEEHGLYEWRVLEPSLDEIIVPLRFRRGVDDALDALAGTLDPARLITGPTFYEQLGVPCLVAAPPGIGGSYDRAATAGATRMTFASIVEGIERLAAAFADPQLRYAYLYWPEIDRLGHVHGPSSPEFRAGAREALDAIATGASAFAAHGVTLLLCADHGHVDVSPDHVDHLDRIWPGLPALLTHQAAGSARDVFLHVVPGEVDRVRDELAERLGARARVCRADELFAHLGDRLAARLGDVAVLPAPGREAWLAATPGPEARNLGAHGGLQPAETSTYLAEVEF